MLATAGIPYPNIDPVLIELGPLVLRWYALAYIAGILAGWQLCIRLAGRQQAGIDRRFMDDFLFWAIIAIIVGGRVGYALLYQPGYYLAQPQEILFVWRGGMSFHGGFLGIVVTVILFCRSRGIAVLALGDLLAVASPIGIGLGRMANFINAELVGRPADVPWAMNFPGASEPRHPSQLYEAGLEGVLLFAVLLAVALATPALQRRGLLSGLFLLGYGLARSIAELFRAPDAHIGFLAGGLTMGQLLSLPMILAGLALIAWAWQRPVAGPGRGEAR